MRNYIVVFQKNVERHWWDIFTPKISHCFLYTEIEGKVYMLNKNDKGIFLEEDDNMRHFRNVVAWFRVQVPPMPLVPHNRVLCTCAGFCASILGIKSFILTPTRLYKEIEQWAEAADQHQSKHQQTPN
jgi:hypothetical protein